MTHSAGIIPFRVNDEGEMEFFIGRPGVTSPNAKVYWGMLKGHVEPDETQLEAAKREFTEESGVDLSALDDDKFIKLGMVQQNRQKIVIAFGVHLPDIDINKCVSNLADDGVNLEIDKYEWATFDDVVEITHPTHIGFYEQLLEYKYEFG